jgi:hypothetical protein
MFLVDLKGKFINYFLIAGSQLLRKSRRGWSHSDISARYSYAQNFSKNVPITQFLLLCICAISYLLFLIYLQYFHRNPRLSNRKKYIAAFFIYLLYQTMQVKSRVYRNENKRKINKNKIIYFPSHYGNNRVGQNLVWIQIVSGRLQARLSDFNESTLLWQRYLQGISRPCHVSATCSFFPTVSTECTYCTVYNGVSYGSACGKSTWHNWFRVPCTVKKR